LFRFLRCKITYFNLCTCEASYNLNTPFQRGWSQAKLSWSQAEPSWSQAEFSWSQAEFSWSQAEPSCSPMHPVCWLMHPRRVILTRRLLLNSAKAGLLKKINYDIEDI